MKTGCKSCNDFGNWVKTGGYCDACFAELFAEDFSPAVEDALQRNLEKSNRETNAYECQVYRQRIGRQKTDS